MKSVLLFSAIVLLFLGSTQAQGSLADLSSDLATYHRDNIRPTMCERRDVLEADISADDRERLAELRNAMAAVQQKEDRNLRNNLLTKSWIETPAARRTFSRSRGLANREVKDLEKLAAKYFDRIDQILTPLANEKLRWDTERLAIRQSYFPNCCNSVGKGKIKDRNQIGIYQKASFLLKEASEEVPMAQTEQRNVELFPNPASTQQQIRFDVQKSGQVYVDLIDSQGNVLQRVFKGILDKGNHQFDVNLDRVRSKFISYRIVDGSGVTMTSTIHN